MDLVFNRKLREDMLPVPYPLWSNYLSPPENVSDASELDRQMRAYEIASKKAMLENERRLELAMPWIKACAALHGLSNSFNLSGQMQEMRHKPWCPYPYWRDLGASLETLTNEEWLNRGN